ncbi:MAG: diguanylate cyclase [Acidobacteriota bacterium]|nr:diguanylate cyclase [Acidobacteriota bacterium]
MRAATTRTMNAAFAFVLPVLLCLAALSYNAARVLPHGGVRLTLTGVAAGNVVAFILIGIAGWIARREFASRTRAQEAIRASGTLYRLLAQNCTDLLATLSHDGRYTYLSPACRGLLGYEPEELLGVDAVSLIHPDDRERLEILRSMSPAGHTALSSYRMERKDGTHVLVETTSGSIAGGDHEGASQLQVCRDVSARKDFEHVLQEREEEFRLLFEDAPIAYHEIDCQGRIQRVNHAFCRLVGMDPFELRGRPIWNLVAPEQREQSREAVLRKVTGEQELRALKRQYLRRDGTPLTLEIHENLIRNAEGEIVGIRSASIDITERSVSESLERGYRDLLETLLQDKPLDFILSGLVRLLERHDPETLYYVLLRQGERLQRGAAPSLPEEFIKAIEAMPAGPIAGSCGAAAYWGKEVIAADIESDPLWVDLKEIAGRNGVRACTSVPIVSGTGSVLGTLASCYKAPRIPSARDLTRMQYAARLASVTIEHRQLADQLSYRAQHDNLTGLPNRYLFEDRLEQALAISGRQSTMFALLFIDLDGFKDVNDQWGHAAGDELLKRVAERLQTNVRRSDTVARIGGDEFTVILNDIGSRDAAAEVGEKLLRAFHDPFVLDNHVGLVTPSIGISVFPDDGCDSATLKRNADAAMYHVKEEGRNNFQFFAVK